MKYYTRWRTKLTCHIEQSCCSTTRLWDLVHTAPELHNSFNISQTYWTLMENGLWRRKTLQSAQAKNHPKSIFPPNLEWGILPHRREQTDDLVLWSLGQKRWRLSSSSNQDFSQRAPTALTWHTTNTGGGRNHHQMWPEPDRYATGSCQEMLSKSL